MRPHSMLLTSAALLALVVAGCGSSSSTTSSTSSPSPATTAPTSTVDPNAPESSPAGDIPDNQAYVAYSPSGSGYSVKVPEGWARTAGAGGAVSFTDKLNRIQMEKVSAKSPPTVTSVTQTDLPLLGKSVNGFAGPKVTTVRRSAGAAVLVTYTATSPADAVTGKVHTDAVERYVFHHSGENVVLTLSGPKGADNVDPWKIVTDSLRYTA